VNSHRLFTKELKKPHIKIIKGRRQRKQNLKGERRGISQSRIKLKRGS